MKRIKKSRWLGLGITVFSGLMLLGLTGLSRDSSDKSACEKEITQLCQSGAEEEQIYNCLKENWTSLSRWCQSHLDKYGKKLGDYHTACEEDLHEKCHGLNFDHPFAAFGCLLDHETEVSDECRYHIRNRPRLFETQDYWVPERD